MNKKLLFTSLIILSLVSIFISISFGPVHIPAQKVFASFFATKTDLQTKIILQLRLPRSIAAFVCGALLALAGALMQVLLRNPLADPYILGVSGGAAMASLLALLFGIVGIWLNVAAFIGALISIIIVFQLSRSGGAWSPVRLLLTGIIIASGWSAIISFILTISPDRMLHNMLFWLMGDLSYANFPEIGLGVLIIAFILSLTVARQLNMLAMGEMQAKGLGVNTKRLTMLIYFLSALLTATAVSIAGSIGFIGLIVPHMVRMLKGSDHRILIPASLLLGGSLLTIADAIARSLLAPTELPVGIITAFIGVPIFLYLLSRGYQKWH